MFVKMKKSKNPFKMWMPYVFAGVWMGLLFIANSICGTNATCVNNWNWLSFPSNLLINSGSTFPYPNLIGGISIIVLQIVIYFLVGWVIHLILRKFKIFNK